MNETKNFITEKKKLAKERISLHEMIVRKSKNGDIKKNDSNKIVIDETFLTTSIAVNKLHFVSAKKKTLKIVQMMYCLLIIYF